MKPILISCVIFIAIAIVFCFCFVDIPLFPEDSISNENTYNPVPIAEEELIFPISDEHYGLDIVYADLDEDVYHLSNKCFALAQLFGYNRADIYAGKHTTKMYRYEAEYRELMMCPECFNEYAILKSIYNNLN